MLRKIRRSVAKYNIANQGISIFGKYSPVTVKVHDKRSGKERYADMNKSYFSRVWRAWSHD